MKMTYKNIINEWFAHLDKGYAMPPYTEKELSILQTILEKYDFMTEKEQPPAKSDEDNKEEKSTSDDRFIAKTALFMQSPENFTEYIVTNYSKGVTISNLNAVFESLSKLTPEVFQDVVKILNTGTNRKPQDGSFNMGQYESLLYDMIKTNIELSHGNPDDLFLSIIYGGKIVGTNLEGVDEITTDIELDGEKGIVSRYFQTLPFVDFGVISSNAIEILDDIIRLADIVSDVQIKNDMSRDALNDIFRMLSDPSIIDEINKLRNMDQTSDIKAMRKIANSIDNILGDKTPDALVVTFLSLLDEYVRIKINNIAYWSTINSKEHTVFLEPSSDIYSIIKSDIENKRLSKSILNLDKYKLNVKGESINKKLLA